MYSYEILHTDSANVVRQCTVRFTVGSKRIRQQNIVNTSLLITIITFFTVYEINYSLLVSSTKQTNTLNYSQINNLYTFTLLPDSWRIRGAGSNDHVEITSLYAITHLSQVNHSLHEPSKLVSHRLSNCQKSSRMLTDN